MPTRSPMDRYIPSNCVLQLAETTSSGVSPRPFLAPTEAPFSSSNSTSCSCAKNEATCKAVLPSWFAIDTSAPFSISSFAILICPNTAAVFSGVDPLPACLAFTDAPAFKSRVNSSRFPSATADQISTIDEAFRRGCRRAWAAASSFAPSVRQYSLEAVRISNLSPATAGLAKAKFVEVVCAPQSQSPVPPLRHRSSHLRSGRTHVRCKRTERP